MRTENSDSDLQVLYEDNHIIAVNKKVGDLVQGDQRVGLGLCWQIEKQSRRVQRNW